VVNTACRLETRTRVYNVPFIIGEAAVNAYSNLEEQPHFRLIDRVLIKGKFRPQSIYEMFSSDPPSLRDEKLAIAETFETGVACYHMMQIEDAQRLFEECKELAPNDTVTRLYLERCRSYKDRGHYEGCGEIDTEVSWSDVYSVSIDHIDNQHRTLLEKMNAVRRLVESRSLTELDEVLNFLQSYAIIHFRDEEQLMHQYDYPLKSQHIHEHERFIEYFKSLRREIESDTHDVRYLIMKVDVFLVDWLLNHTTGIDRHLGNFLLANGYKS